MNRTTALSKISLPVHLACVGLGVLVWLGGCASHSSFPSGDTTQAVQLSGYLYRPDGNGPFPAMVLLHNCAGVEHVFAWASWLKGQGYVALAVDSLRPRGTTNVCGRGRNPSVRDVMWDAVGALAHLHSLQFVDPSRIGVIGWSYGAMATLQASTVRAPGRGFRAAVAFYPHCSYMSSDLMIPLLLLLGESDNWTPPALCVDTAKRLQQEGRPVLFTVYPGAHHGFDNPAHTGGRQVLGYTLYYDRAATADSEKRVRDFLARHLKSQA